MREKQAKLTTRFISLKWKAMLAFSFVLIIVNGGLAGMGYLQLREQFTQHQIQARHQQVQELEALIGDSFTKLEMIASLIPTIGVKRTASESIQQRLETILSDQAATLEFDWGIDEASYFTNENTLAFSWRPTNNVERFQPMIQEVNATESPDFELDCANQCRQYIAVPVLDVGQKKGCFY